MVQKSRAPQNPTYDPPVGYYNPATGLRGQALFNALHTLVKGHTIIPLDATTTESTVSALKTLYADPADNARILLSYGTQSVTNDGYSISWQREYLWSQSRGIYSTGADASDLFNLCPVAPAIATARGTRVFDVSDWDSVDFTSPAALGAGLTSGKDGDSWEPPADQRGDVARAIFYMDLRYNGNLAEDPDTTDLVLENSIANPSDMSVLKTLLVWNALDPVSDAERRRNDQIFRQYQHNRNPFVDHPEYALSIYGVGAGAPTDNDGDGMEDAWERVAHLQPTRKMDAAEDPDGDGFTNFEEHWMGSDPRDPASPITTVVDCTYTGTLELGTPVAPYKTIQAAINNAPAFELRAVLVSPGSYHERPYVSASAQIHIFSTHGPTKTFIEGEKMDSSAVRFYNFKKASFVGFTVRNADTDWRGAGLRIMSPEGSILVSSNSFLNNISTFRSEPNGGGAIYIEAGAGSVIANNMIVGNRAQRGGGVVFAAGNVGFYNNTVAANVAWGNNVGGGLSALPGVQPVVRNNIIWDNRNLSGSNQIDFTGATGNILQNGGFDNITQDPKFISPYLQDYNIRANSPGRNQAVSPAVLPMDVDGELRPREEGRAKDIGADEFLDSDGDGMPDSWELRWGLNPANPADGSNKQDLDTLTDRQEYDAGTSPRDPDTDHDGMPDGWEVENGLNPVFNDAGEDLDNDGLTNIQEYGYKTWANNPDSDGDRMWDGWEVQYGFDPTKSFDGPLDADNDGVSNVNEFLQGTDPLEDSGTDVGTMAGSASVDLSGSFNYSIPIWVTPGTAGMQPKLSFNYSNKGGNGIMGKGWSLAGASSITRAAANRRQDAFIDPVDFDDNDRFVLDGARLILVRGTYGAPNSEYRTEMESMQKITFSGGAFTVVTKSGLTMTYGGTPEANYNIDNKGVLRWSITRIVDGNGNAMIFNYDDIGDDHTFDGSREQILTNIQYTQTNASGAYARVVFVYQERPKTDQPKMFVAGMAVRQRRKLIGVENYYGNALVKKYEISYTSSPSTNFSLVSKIKEGGLNGASFKATTFKYSSIPNSLDHDQWSVPDAGNYYPGQTWSTGDYNGDGASDLLKVYKDSGKTKVRVYPSRPSNTAFSNDNDWVEDGGNFQDTDRWISGDFNGDGLIDLARVGNFSNDGKIKVYQNAGGTGFSNPQDYYRQGSEFKPYARWFAADFNADGFLDLCSIAGTDNYGANGSLRITMYANNGHGEFTSHIWSSDGKFDNSDGWFVGDFSGDGLPDICRVFENSDKTSVDVFKNNYHDDNANTVGRSRWLESTKRWGDWAWKTGDLNGDGQVDLVAANQDGDGDGVRVYLSKGNDFDGENTWANGADFKSPDDIHLGDFNGDGRCDMIIIRPSGDDGSWKLKRTTYLSRGGDFKQVSSALLSVSNAEVRTKAWLPGDFNGDGKEDIGKLSSESDSGSRGRVTVWSSEAGANDLMLSTVNGVGALTSVQYSTLLDPGVYIQNPGNAGDFQADSITYKAPMVVVKQISGDNGVGGINKVDYSYRGLRASRSHGLLGFRIVQAVDETTGLTATNVLRQKYPFIGMAENSITKRTSDGRILNQSVNEMGDLAALHTGVHFPYVSMAMQYNYELDGAFTKWTRTWTNYYGADGTPEPYCNPVSITVEDSGGFSTTTENVYAHDVAKWHIGRLASATVTSRAPGRADSVKHSGFDYSNTNGQLAKETIEPGAAALVELKTEYGFDAFGNTNLTKSTGSRDLLGTLQERISRTDYTSWNGRFVTSSTNALGHSDWKDYNELFGLVSQVTDPNNLVASWEYDNFGRAKETVSPNQIRSVTRYGRPDAESPTFTSYYIEQQTANLPASRVYYNKLGKALRTRQVDAMGRVVYTDSQYDALGRLRFQSRPYFPGSAPIWSETRYDILNRPYLALTPNDEGTTSTISYAYQALESTVTDPLGHATTTTYDSQGRVIRVKNHLQENMFYGFDAAGNATEITDHVGNVTSIQYDQRGRKTQMIDADTGKWDYAYNAFGELVRQRDWDRAADDTEFVAHTEETDYDGAGRVVEHREAEATDRWFYDATPRGNGTNWLGKLTRTTRTLAGQSVPDYVSEAIYDGYGRVERETKQIEGEAFTSATTYDYLGRPETLSYPNTGFRVRNHYNSQGAVDEVWREDGTGALLWKAEDYSVDGALKSYLLGNGVRTQRGYYANSGRLHTIQSGVSGSSAVQNLSYEFDRVGNLKKRQDLAQGKTEEFGYDELYRLRTSTLNGVSNGDTTYDALGNIASKSGLGAYLYDPMRPHAVSQIGSDVKSYDDNGNLLSGSGRTMSWTSFDMPEVITRGDASSRFRYDDGHNRIVQVAIKAGLTTKTIYVGGYERIFDGATYKHRHYVATPAGMTAVFVATVTVVSPGVPPGRTDMLSYQHQDHLGSMDAITDGVTGAVIERQSFDAWGLKRDSGWTPGPGATGSFYNRGFTGHEQLDDLGLVHMNGRIYDPIIGRFLTADPNVQFAGNLQSYNRYSYVLNNPLSFTDPSGYLLNWIFPELGGQIGSWLTDTFGENAIPVVSAVAGYVAGFWAGPFGPIVSGAVSAGTAAILSGASNEDAAVAAAQGAGIGLVTAGVGAYVTPAISSAYGAVAANAFQVVANAAIAGGTSELMGGSFQDGALASLATSALSPTIQNAQSQSWVAGLVVSSVVGGTAAEIGGGKFANGAISAAFMYAVANTPTAKDLTVKSLVQGIGTSAKIAIERVIGENWGYGWRNLFSQSWVDGPTGGKVPPFVAEGMQGVLNGLPKDALSNGMHAWHAGSNAYLANTFGLLGGPVILFGGVYHESPFDSFSFWSEQSNQGTVNHILDSSTDLIANVYGMSLGYTVGGSTSTRFAISSGNYIPGPGDPDTTVGGKGNFYTGNPTDLWGPYR